MLHWLFSASNFFKHFFANSTKRKKNFHALTENRIAKKKKLKKQKKKHEKSRCCSNLFLLGLRHAGLGMRSNVFIAFSIHCKDKRPPSWLSVCLSVYLYISLSFYVSISLFVPVFFPFLLLNYILLCLYINILIYFNVQFLFPLDI